MIRRKWHILDALTDSVLTQRLRAQKFAQSRASHFMEHETEITPILVQLLHNRGIENPDEFAHFLLADDRLSNDPFLLPDIERSVDRVLKAIRGDELIAVYGDFDADGITGTVLLVQSISTLGGKVIHYIPHRIEEGHGLNKLAIAYLKKQGVSLIVTVDCGVTELAEVAYANELGLDVVITDHHIPAKVIPPALGAIDPKRSDSDFKFIELAGVGVAFKFLQALFSVARREPDWDTLLELVVLGTVADMVPLIGENRYLVKRGLEAINRSKRPGLLELVNSSGLEIGKIDAESISYRLGPRLNASGRVDHSVTSYELLMASSRENARQLAATLEANNIERQRLTAEIFGQAREKVLAEYAGLPLLMIGGEGYPPGVVGVVAGKLVNEFYRPSIVLNLDGDVARGSARSIPEFDIVAALNECSDLLTRFGGHRQAAGFIIPVEKTGELSKRLVAIAERELVKVDLRPVLTIDMALPLSEVSSRTFKQISKLAPFGQANHIPTFLSRGVQIVESKTVGENGEHLKLKIRSGRVIWDAIGFDLGDRQLASHIDVVYNLEVEQWGGKNSLRLRLLDLLPA